MANKVHVIESNANPASAPTAVNQHWLNTSTKQIFYSVGTSSVADWKELGLSGGGSIPDPVDYNPTIQGWDSVTGDLSYTVLGKLLIIKGRLLMGNAQAVEARIGLPSGYVTNTRNNLLRVSGYAIRDAGAAVYNKYHTIIVYDNEAFFKLAVGEKDEAISPTNNLQGIQITGAGSYLYIDACIEVA